MAKNPLFTIDGDLVLENNGPIMIDGLNEIKQSINNILATQKGAWLDEDVGMDYSWLVGGYDENAAITAIEEAVLQDRRVTDILNIDPSYDEQNHRVDFYLKINTTLGVLDFTKEVELNAFNG